MNVFFLMELFPPGTCCFRTTAFVRRRPETTFSRNFTSNLTNFELCWRFTERRKRQRVVQPVAPRVESLLTFDLWLMMTG